MALAVYVSHEAGPEWPAEDMDQEELDSRNHQLEDQGVEEFGWWAWVEDLSWRQREDWLDGSSHEVSK